MIKMDGMMKKPEMFNFKLIWVIFILNLKENRMLLPKELCLQIALGGFRGEICNLKVLTFKRVLLN